MPRGPILGFLVQTASGYHRTILKMKFKMPDGSSSWLMASGAWLTVSNTRESASTFEKSIATSLKP
jgi:hypothetical protein